MKAFKIHDNWFVYDTDEDGEKIGDPIGPSYKTREEAQQWIDDESAPQEAKIVKAVGKALADTLGPMQKAMEGILARVDARGNGGGGLYEGAEGEPATVKSKFTLLDFILAVTGRNEKALKAMGSEFKEIEVDKGLPQVTQEALKVLGDQTGITGGFLVPTQFIPELIRVDPEREIVWPRARVVPMQNRVVQFPGLDMTGSTAGQTNMIGGVLPEWNETGTRKPETEPHFTQITLTAHEFSAYTEVKAALLQDSPISIETLLRTLFRESLVFYRDEAFLDGTGAGMPQGVVTAPGTFVQPRDTAGHIVYEDIKNMWMHLLASSQGNAVWVINQMCFTELADMVDQAGNLIWQPNARDNQPERLFGRPIIWTEKTPTLGLQGDILLADFRWYYIGDKQDVMIGSSADYLFRQNRIAYRCSLRVDGQEAISAPIFLKDGLNQVSPFVVLGAGAAT